MSSSATNKIQEVYSDFRANMDPHPVRGDLIRLVNADAIKRSVRNILLTNPYERFTDFYFGAGLRRHLFENVSPVLETAIKNDIETAIKNYEPRANLISVVVAARPENNAYTATITFSVINNIAPVELTVFLERIR